MTKFYVVATPIGNLEDITLRAIRILKEVDCVLCEDTRMTKRIFDKYDIHTPTLSYHSKSKISRVDDIIKMLEDGKNLALVSDAGTPGISDPGALLVSKIRGTLKDIKIETIPGPSALTSAISIAGVPSAEFVFLGFLPHKKGRETLFKEIFSSDRTYIFYESPHRILKTLQSLKDFEEKTKDNSSIEIGNKNVTILRELTKIYEEIFQGTPKEALDFFQNNIEKQRGEFVFIVSRSSAQ